MSKGTSGLPATFGALMILKTERFILLMMPFKNIQILMESIKWEINFLIGIFKGIWSLMKKPVKMLCMKKFCLR